MKIAWFTPFSKTSAIGRVSQLITDELARKTEVHIWHPEAAELHPSALRLISYPLSLKLEPSMLAAYDLIVYNMGNYLPFHRQIFEIARSAPGLVILHDFVMHHFFAAYYLEHRQDPREYRAAMVRLYGERGRSITEESNAGKRPWVWETDDVAEFPFFEEAIRGAWGVVVHSEFFRQQVATIFPGPVRKLGLPYCCGSAAGVCSREELGVPPGKTLIVTVGHVNPNKRIHSVIEALGVHADLRRDTFYVVVGPCDESYRQRLDGLIQKYDLGDTVRFSGYASEEHLQGYLAHSDICINLRHPFTEGASASAIEEMLYGKAVVVSDTGFFRELPDDCVRKVDLRNEAEQLEQTLRGLVADPRARKELGARARRYAEAHFRADDYAKGIVELAGELMDAKPILEHVDRVGKVLAEMGVSPEMPIVDTVSRTCLELFCSPDDAGGELGGGQVR